VTPQTRWPSFGYIQVPGLANRLISRYLRTQRKNMRRFFQERGLFTLLDRMNQIRNSRQGMLAKNRMFQEVLNLYAAQNSMHTRGNVSEPVESVHGMRSAEIQGMAIEEPGEGEVKVDRMEEGEPGEATRDS
jgi:hypothetical protein